MIDTILTENIKSIIQQLGLISTGKLYKETHVIFDENSFTFIIKSTDYYEFLDKDYNITNLFLNLSKEYIANKTKEYIIKTLNNL